MQKEQTKNYRDRSVAFQNSNIHAPSPTSRFAMQVDDENKPQPMMVRCPPPLPFLLIFFYYFKLSMATSFSVPNASRMQSGRYPLVAERAIEHGG